MPNNNSLINPKWVFSAGHNEDHSLNLNGQKVPFENMVAIIQWHLARHPDREVLSFLREGETLAGSVSFASLDKKAREIAVQLASCGERGDRALLVFHNGIDFITAFFGCLYAGVCAVPVYPPQNRQAYLERLEMIASDCGARYMLGIEDYFTNVEERLQAFETLGATAKIAVDNLSVNPNDYSQPELALDSLAFLQYTSGSTSAPKGVMVSHGNLINNIVSMQYCFGHDEDTVIVSWLPMFHDMGLIGAVLQPICIGAKVVAMAPAAFLQKPVRWLDAVAKYRGTSTYAPNFAYELCVAKAKASDIERLDLSSWTMALNGAEPIKPETLEAFKETFAPCGFVANAIYPGYGLAEATLFVSGAPRLTPTEYLDVSVADYEQKTMMRPATDTSMPTRRLVSSGIPSPYNEVVIVDPDSHERLTDGQVGEVWVQGKSVAMGYWQNEEKTIETFHANIVSQPNKSYMRTGDLGFLHRQHLYICGRIKEVIIIRGANYYPQNIEQSLQSNIEGIRVSGGAAFTVERQGEEQLVVIQEVERTWLKKIDKDEAIQKARHIIAQDYGLSLYALVLIRPMTLPKTSSGKIQRAKSKIAFESDDLKVVAKFVREQSADTTPQLITASANAATAHLDKAVTDLLLMLTMVLANRAQISMAQIDPTQPITNTGCDSLALNEMSDTLKNITGVRLPLGTLLQSDSLIDIANNIQAARQQSQPQPQFELPDLQKCEVVQGSTFDLSVNQLQMWLLYQKAPNSCAYNVPFCLIGQFDFEHLTQVLVSLLQAHPMLRTAISYDEQTKKWQQTIMPLPQNVVTEHHLSASTDVDQHIINASGKPFALTQGENYRFDLFVDSKGQQRLLLNFHHIVVDLLSVQLFVKQLLGKLADSHMKVAEQGASYRDFIAWQSAFAASEAGKNARHYWQQKLSSPVPALQWPLPNARPKALSFAGSSFEFTSTEVSSADIGQAAATLGLTVNALILSVYQLFLAKLCNQRQFAIGVLNAGRPSVDFDNTLGYFIEPAVFVSNVGVQQSFATLGKQTRQQLIELINNAGSSLATMLEQSESQFQTLLTFYPHRQNALLPFNDSMSSIPLEAFSGFATMPLPSTGAQLDLSLIVADDAQAMQFRFEYNTALFDAQTMTTFSAYFCHLLNAVVKTPDCHIDALALQSGAKSDHQRLMAARPKHDFGETLLIHQLFERQASECPNQVALRYNGQTLSYQALNNAANHVAALLLPKVDKQQAVGVYCERSFEMVVSLLAVLKAGCAYVPLDPTLPAERINTIIETADINWVVARHKPDIKFAAQVLTLDAAVYQTGDVTKNIQREVGSDDLAYIIFTSGSTGKPKGVMNTHGAIQNRLLWMQQAYSLNDNDKILQKTPFTFDVSVWEFFLPLISGATMVLAKPEGHKNADYLSSLICEEQVTTLHFVPSMLDVFLTNKTTHLNSVRQVFCSGEALSSELQKRFFARFGHSALHNLYGPTEAAVDVSYWACQAECQRQRVPIGKAIANIDLYVLDMDLQPVPCGVTGELFIAGVGLARGYANQPELTEQSFLPDTISQQPGGRMYRTGDLVRYDQHGIIDYLGRSDSQVKIRGFRIELGEIDANLLQIAQVNEAVTVVTGSNDDKVLAAYVVLGDELSTTQIKSQLGEHLPEYMVPTFITVLDAMPLNANGKLDRKSLPAPHNDLQGELYQAPASAEEKALAVIWAQVLGLNVEQISTQHNFFALGGHSLSAAKMAMQAKLNLRDVFAAPVLQELALKISQNSDDKTPQPAITSAPRDRERYALSAAQSRLWFLTQIQGQGAAYNIPTVLQIEGPLNVERLTQSIDAVISQHEILRSRYIDEDHVPYQLIDANPQLTYELCDWTELSEAACKQQGEQLMAEHAETPFDLATELPLRVTIVTEQPTRHKLLICLHHIAADGVTLALLLDQIGERYRQVKGADDKVQLQYLDYCHWQQSEIAGQKQAQQLDYWTEQLQGLAPLLALPTDAMRPVKQTVNGDCVAVAIDQAQTARLKQLADDNDASLYMVVLSAYKLLLSIYTGVSDIAVGTPVSGRTHADLDAVMGYFANTVVLRNRVEKDMTFGQLLAGVKETTVAAFEHQDLPLEVVVDALQTDRSLSYSPLFQVMFSLEHQPDVSTWLGEQTHTSRVSRLHRLSKFDLSLMLQQDETGVNGYFEFNTDLFNRASVEQLAGHFTHIISSLSEPTTLLGDIQYLGKAEKQQLLQGFNQAPEAICSTISEQFAMQVSRHADKIAVSFGEQQLSYAKLDKRSNVVANYLLEQNVKGAVAVYLAPGINAIVALLGIAKAGAYYVPLDTASPDVRKTALLETINVSHLLSDNLWCTDFVINNSETTVVNLDLLVGSQLSVAKRVSPDDLAYLMFTSGSTGKPKGTLIYQHAVTRLAVSPDYVQLNSNTVMLQAASLAFDAATFEIWGALLNGGTLMICPQPVLNTNALQQMKAVNTAWLTAALFHQLVDEDVSCLDNIKQLLVGGDVVSPEHVAKVYRHNPTIQMINGYGPTESTTFAATHAIDRNQITTPSGSIAIGRAINGTKLFVLDEQQQPVPVNVVGQLYIGGLGLAQGYYQQPTLTREQFIDCAWDHQNAIRLYRSGDLVRRLPGGELEFIGRVDNQVKVRGFRIELAEIEQLLAQQEGVDSCAVIVSNERLIAYVTCLNDDTDSIHQALKQQLPSYMVPSFVIKIEQLPLTRNGKLDRDALPDHRKFIIKDERVEPHGEHEEKLAAIWADLLELDGQQISRDSNFFSLGGHSLLSAKLVAQCAKVWSGQLDIREVFNSTSLADMATRLNQSTAPQDIQSIAVVDRAQSYGLSYAQARLWFLTQLEQFDSSYNVPLTLQFSPAEQAVDGDALVAALKQIVVRHEILRTRYKVVDGIAQQQIIAADEALQLLDMQRVYADTLTMSTDDYIKQFNAMPFDLVNQLPIRGALIHQANSNYILCVSIHHIATDGASMLVFNRELSQLYHAKSTSVPLSIQYLDYSQWQPNWLAKGREDQQAKYWQQQLAGSPPKLDLPTDYPRPVTQTYHGDCYPVTVPSRLVAPLQALAQQHQCSLYMVMLCGFQIMLAKYSAEQDIAVGTPVANRPLSELEPLIGFFANTLVIRTEVDAQAKMSDLLASVRENTLSAYANQDLPFESLVELLQPQRSLSYSPLFQVMFSLQHDNDKLPEFDGINVQSIKHTHRVSKFDLSFMLAQNKAENEGENRGENNGKSEDESVNNIDGYLEYNTDLYNVQTIKRMWSHYCYLLEQMIEQLGSDSDILVKSLKLARDSELAEQYQQLNKPMVEGKPDTLIQMFAAQVAKTPDAIAVRHWDEQLSYAQLDAQVNVIANRLIEKGVKGNVAVAVYLPRTMDLLVSLLAIQRTGAFYVPLDPKYPQGRLQDILSNAKPVAVITNQLLLDNLPTDVNGDQMARVLTDDIVIQSSFSAPLIEVDSQDTAYAIYTSGSTGKPKGIAISHHNVGAMVRWAIEQYAFDELSHVLAATSICFDLSVFELFVPLCVGGCVDLVDDVLALAEARTDGIEPSLINTVPSAMVALLRLNRMPTSATTINLAGEPLGRELVNELYQLGHVDKVYNLYGPSEDTTYSTYALVPRDLAAMPTADKPTIAKPTISKPTIGKPITNTHALVLDEGMNLLPIGVAGELYLAGDGVTKGYIGNPEQTALAYVQHNGQRWYKTGDKVRLLDSGELDYLGRIDNQVKLRGFRIELNEIEAVIAAVAGVDEAVVVVNTEQSTQPQLVAFITLNTEIEEQHEALLGSIRARSAEQLPDYMQPAFLQVLAQLPHLPNGKIDRKALATRPIAYRAGESGLQTQRSPLQSITEHQLGEIWTQLLGIEAVFLQDNFFELGGHSLLATQLISRVAQATDVQLTIKDIFQHSTLQAMANLVDLLRATTNLDVTEALPESIEQEEGSI